MRPYLIVTGDFRRTGGMDRANLALAQHLADRGTEVHLVAHFIDDELRARPNVHCVDVPKPANSYLLAGPLLARAGVRRARLVAGRGGRVVVNGGNCPWGDVNWVHYVHAAYRVRAAGSPLRRAKRILDGLLSARDERRALRRARLVLANSDRTGRDVVERIGVDPAIVRTAYLGIDPERFGPIAEPERRAARERFGWPEGRPLVAFVGALGDRRKGFDTLFAAWSRLCADPDWDADLVVVGAGAEQPLWEGRAASAGLADRFRFLGYTREVPTVLAACDALVHPVRYEAYGMGVQEALARGLPAIVGASAGVAEHYGPELADLLLPDPEDAEGLAGRLHAWRDRREALRGPLAELGARLRAHTWERMAEGMVEMIEATG